MKKMKTSQQGLDLIKEFEGLRLEAYKCPAGVWTVGYGTTKGVKPGMKITEKKAEKLLLEDVKQFETFLNRVRVNFCQECFDAIIDWLYNLGTANFNRSTMRQFIIGDRDDEEITDQLVKWVNSGGIPLTGLKRRRIAEANLFLGYERYSLDKDNNIIKI
jgi:lysozyme